MSKTRVAGRCEIYLFDFLKIFYSYFFFDFCSVFFLEKDNSVQRRIWGGARTPSPPPPLRDSTPCRPKGSTLWYFKEIQFWPTNLKIFLKAPLAPIYTNFEGGARAKKKRNFSVKVFQKVPKNAFFGLLFQNFACGAENFAKIGTKQCFGRAREINLVDLKKGRQNFRNFF